MKIITAYETSDGKLFSSEQKATKHQADIIGEMLDGLLPYDDRGNVTRIDRFNLLTKMLGDPDLALKINALASAINHRDDDQQER